MPEPENEQQAPPEKENRGTTRRIAKTPGRQAVNRIAAQAATRVAATALLNPWVLGVIIIIILIFFIIIFIIVLFAGDEEGVAGGGTTSCNPTASQSAIASQSATTGDILTHDAAVQLIKNAGIAFTSTKNCTDKHTLGCTSFEGIKQGTINGVVSFKQKSGASFIITGAAEVPPHSTTGQYTHGNGYKIDIGSDGSSDAVSNYIKNNLNPDGVRPGLHGGPRYIDHDKNEYVYETGLGHWDIAYIGNNSTPANPAGGQGCVEGGGGNFGGGGASGSFADCNGIYTSIMAKNRFLKENFGDPQCDFTIPLLDQQLQQLDPVRALKWHTVLKYESGLSPLAWADPGIGTPNPYGAWGLFQMGSRFKSNSSSDIGDTRWQSQISNAINYMKAYNNNDPYRYWCQWNKQFPGGDGLGHTASRPNCR